MIELDDIKRCFWLHLPRYFSIPIRRLIVSNSLPLQNLQLELRNENSVSYQTEVKSWLLESRGIRHLDSSHWPTSLDQTHRGLRPIKGATAHNRSSSKWNATITHSSVRFFPGHTKIYAVQLVHSWLCFINTLVCVWLSENERTGRPQPLTGH